MREPGSKHFGIHEEVHPQNAFPKLALICVIGVKILSVPQSCIHLRLRSDRNKKLPNEPIFRCFCGACLSRASANLFQPVRPGMPPGFSTVHPSSFPQLIGVQRQLHPVAPSRRWQGMLPLAAVSKVASLRRIPSSATVSR